MIFVGCDKHEEKRIDAENRGKFRADFGLHQVAVDPLVAKQKTMGIRTVKNTEILIIFF